MKKILSIFAIAAVVLGLASCNKDNETNLKRFKINLENITATSADVTIVPPDEQTKYVGLMFNEASFKFIKEELNELNAVLKLFAAHQGSYTNHLDGLYPNTKWVLCVGEIDEETNEIVGDVEYTRFQTPSMEAQLPDNPQPLAMTGECWFYTEQKNFILITGNYPVPDADGEKMELAMFFVSDKLTGHFTTDDMVAYIFLQSNITVKDSDNKQEAWYAICGADITGSFDSATGIYTYTGTCDLFSEEDGLMRLPVSIQCTEYKSEN